MTAFMLIFISCNDSGKQSTEDTSLDETAPLEVEELFVIPERPFDMTWDSDETMLISADASGKLYRWDGTELVEEVGTFHDIQAVHIMDDTLYYTTTDNGVTGALIDESGTPLITQSSDGTLLRWPVDITHTPSGTILIADYNAGIIFTYEQDGTSQLFSAGSQTPLALAFVEEVLYIGGEDGVFQKEWPDGIATKIDERSANGLVTYDGLVYASNSVDGIFVVEGVSYPLPDNFGRPSALLIQENMLYVIDQVGRGIWQTSL